MGAPIAIRARKSSNQYLPRVDGGTLTPLIGRGGISVSPARGWGHRHSSTPPPIASCISRAWMGAPPVGPATVDAAPYLPRVDGGTPARPGRVAVVVVSPARGWGHRTRANRRPRLPRISRAWMGAPGKRVGAQNRRRYLPRVDGGTRRQQGAAGLRDVSPARGWGHPRRRWRSTRRYRISRAWMGAPYCPLLRLAGSTYLPRVDGGTAPHHARCGALTYLPRVEGGHLPTTRDAQGPWASPARGGGARTGSVIGIKFEGISRAWRGGTSSGSTRSPELRHLPRVEGGHALRRLSRCKPFVSPARGGGALPSTYLPATVGWYLPRVEGGHARSQG